MNLGARLEGRHVLVVGGSEALGAHFAAVAAGCGAAVTLACEGSDRVQRLIAGLRDIGAPRVGAVDLAFGDETSTAQAFEALRDDPVDVLVNVGGNASSQGGDGGVAPDMRGVWLTCTAAARRWRETQRGGVVVNVAPAFGPAATEAAMSSTVSRAGIVQMTAVLALEWARYGIRVNTLAPGLMEAQAAPEAQGAPEASASRVKRIPLRRLGRPEDLDGAFLLLATDASAWMTGTTVTVDGGHLVTSL